MGLGGLSIYRKVFGVILRLFEFSYCNFWQLLSGKWLVVE